MDRIRNPSERPKVRDRLRPGDARSGDWHRGSEAQRQAGGVDGIARAMGEVLRAARRGLELAGAATIFLGAGVAGIAASFLICPKCGGFKLGGSHRGR